MIEIQDKKGMFYFRVKAFNGQILVSSEAYTSKSGVLNGIASLEKIFRGFDKIEIKYI